jgi:hypothetical protein
VRTAELKEITGEGWRCGRCDAELVSKQVDVTYMASVFSVELPCCPACGFTFIPPELANGKMEEAEKILEDK